MARGEFERSLLVPSDPGSVWETITDVDLVVSWLSVVRSVTEEERLRRYTAVLEDRVGPFRLKADLSISTDEVQEGERLVAHAEGQDRQVGSRLRVEASLALSDSPDGTRLDLKASYEVTGRVASLGDSTIRRKAATLVEEFFSNAELALGGASSGTR